MAVAVAQLRSQSGKTALDGQMTGSTKKKAAERRLADFRAKLETLSSEESQADLDARRIRSPERRAITGEILATRMAEEAVADTGAEKGRGTAAHRGAATGLRPSRHSGPSGSCGGEPRGT
jgi:hypothetical protein